MRLTEPDSSLSPLNASATFCEIGISGRQTQMSRVGGRLTATSTFPEKVAVAAGGECCPVTTSRLLKFTPTGKG